ncbi:tetratricopeptide repeat protein [Spartinivicinus ruber]|uniref:tetratricopeptide repeat protein n=1 Tax=Spartinivicinus ruber TaxID=2683272 RepID=UPI0013D13EF2|nr:tetratricopeptide repeat protein [Spartinivicinus ruber]
MDSKKIIPLRRDQAINSVNYGFEPTPENIKEKYEEMRSLYYLDKIQETLNLANTLLQIDLKSAGRGYLETSILHYKGGCHTRLQDYRAALTAFKQITEINKFNNGAWAAITLIYLKLGQHEKAIQASDKALEIYADKKQFDFMRMELKL